MFSKLKVTALYSLLGFFSLSGTYCNAQETTIDFSYLDYHLPFEERVDVLLSQMTLDEKVSQMTNESKSIPRLQIPEYNWWNECLHGVARAGYATVFPQSISVAASFDKELMKEIGSVISDEARAKHHEFLHQNKRTIYTGLDFWSPNVNIFRDPRWGRGHETYGEDPYLTGELATEFILGLQGNDPKYYKTIATAKHFAVHSGPEKLRHSFDVDVSDRDLYETYLPAFFKTIKEAKVYSVMGAYNRFRGESCSGHDFLLNQLLRDSWGFEGYVVSDCGAIRDIETGHHIAKSKPEAAAIGVKGGCDLNCRSYYKSLGEAVKEGFITEEQIDVALRRILMARFKMGMFDPEEVVPYSKIPTEIVCSDVNTELARKAAQESIVLLKNSNNLLPLAKDQIKKIAVIGPNADNWESLVGNYHGTPKNPVTFFKGIKNKVEPQIKVLYAEGSHLDDETLNLKPISSVYLQTEDGRQGLEGAYFNNTQCSGEPEFTRVDDKIDFSWQYAPVSKTLVDTFSIRWKGYLLPPANGTYELGLYAKRGMTIKIEGKEISIGKGSAHHPQYATDRLVLEGGKKYHIEIEFYTDETNAQACLLWAMPDKNLIDDAVKVTKEADVAVVVVGLSQRLEGEGGDRNDISLPKQQEELIEAVKATGKPVILVINAGSSLAINWAKDNIDAIVNVGYPGEQGGNALADVLFGDYNPAGRLPITYYASLDELPPFEDYDMKNRTYRYYKGKPLYPFGYGLSYTSFKYSDLQLPTQTKAGDTLNVSVKVTNVGDRDGDEVVQLYISDVKSSTPRPIHQLEGFDRIHLKAGESKIIEFTLTPRQLSMINKKTQRVIEPGTFDIYVGGEQPGFSGDNDALSTEVIKASFKVLGHQFFKIK
ncbi:glycoside hydrolase family 3 C-terminal domain-containing protein [Plebeiibacterium sediminum]|uniref:Glycoside hydrolase family 3 C-terminal domain-containing protein n=1 Tax=Plebeiibacterium sediminum TaxID=2992112 RepID=A0AAE3M7I2_9BACT|nr:glycoside hydrolase family 3 C-terminal domain-containing protein [Plebeiobacterium sediminum]MCW3787975.1 glycoside hydrolase family 3 C-terminal domain-containing protein [Plebeiobacterium sediminum]